MLLVYTTDLPFISPPTAVTLLNRFAQFKPRLAPRPEGGFRLVIPSSHRPLSTLRILKEFDSTLQWRLFGIDDSGDECVPITAAGT